MHAQVRGWIEAMANFIKAQDGNHLISSGESGYSTATPTTNIGTLADTADSCLPCEDQSGGAASPNPFSIYHNFINGMPSLHFAASMLSHVAS